MERLTKRNEHGKAYYPYCFKENTCDGLGTSEQCDMCDFDQNVCEKLAEYEDLEEQGRLIKLPFKVGDEFWVIVYLDKKIIRVKCTGYTILIDTVNMIDHSYVWLDSIDKPMDYWELTFNEFYKRCFKTKEEAEKALAEMECE